MLTFAAVPSPYSTCRICSCDVSASFSFLSNDAINFAYRPAASCIDAIGFSFSAARTSGSSGADRLALEAGRWLLLAAGAGMAVPLFLGGGAGPVLPAWAWSAAKTLAVLALLVWGRRRVPVLRADRYAELAWVVLIPLTIGQALVPALVDLTR